MFVGGKTLITLWVDVRRCRGVGCELERTGGG